MFEIGKEGGPKEPLKAMVRYVRRQWVYDPYGKVDASEAAKAKVGLTDTTGDPGSGGINAENYADTDGRPFANLAGATGGRLTTQINYYAMGYHRMDAVYIGEFEATYDGKLQPAQAKEESIRPWNTPRSLTGPQRYQTRGVPK